MKFLLIIKKMKNIFRNILYLFVFLISLSGCQSVKDGLTGKKITNSDEFLVEKKNPLVLPPEFQKLPEPSSLNKKKINNDENDISLKKILTQNTSKTETTSISENTDKSLEKSILEKIKSY